MKTEGFVKWIKAGGNGAFAIDDNPVIVDGVKSLIVVASELGKRFCPSATFSVEIVDNCCTVCYELDGRKYECAEKYNPICIDQKEYLKALRGAAFNALHCMAVVEHGWDDAVYDLLQQNKSLPGLYLDVTIQNELSRTTHSNTVYDWLEYWNRHDDSLPADDAPVVNINMWRHGEVPGPETSTKGMSFMNLMERLWATYRSQFNKEEP